MVNKEGTFAETLSGSKKRQPSMNCIGAIETSGGHVVLDKFADAISVGNTEP